MKKPRNTFSEQFERLKEKVIWRADQLGIDLTEDGAIENLLKIGDGATDADGNTNDSWEAASWPDRIFAMAFRCSSENDFGDTGDNELIDALCLGNWAIGFVDGLPGEEPDPHVCVQCLIKQHVSAIGKSGAAARLANDPKQKEKSFVYDCWQSWQKNPDSYKGKAAFARDMLTKCERLESQKKIEDWCRVWERNDGTQPAE